MPGRGGHRRAAIALVVAALVGGCAEDERLASLAPPDAPLYAEFELDPDAGIVAFGERLLGISDPGTRLAAELDGVLAQAPGGLSFAEDVEPWLGEQGALFVRSYEPAGMSAALPELALALEVDDLEGAEAALERFAEAIPGTAATHGGHEYRLLGAGEEIAAGLVDETLLIGTEACFKVAVDAAEGESLADSDEFDARMQALPEQRLAAAYLEPAAAIEAALVADGEGERARMLGPLLAGPLSSPAALALSAEGESASIDVVTALSEAEQAPAESPLLEGLPGNSWLAIAAPDLGQAIERTLEGTDNSGVPGDGTIAQEIRAHTGLDPRTDLLDWLSDTAGFAAAGAGERPVAGIVAETDDPEGPRELLAAARRHAAGSVGEAAGGVPAGADYGFRLGGIEAGVFGHRVVAVSGERAAAALEPAQRLGDDPGYQEAMATLGDELVPGLYADLPALLSAAGRADHAGGGAYARAAPYLGRLRSLAGGSTVEDGLERSRLTLTLLP